MLHPRKHGSLEYDFKNKGLSNGGFAGHFESEFIQVISNIRNHGGKIHMDLKNVDPSRINIRGNPNTVADGFTQFELRNITRNKDWFENTTFYGADGNVLSASQLKSQFGIEPLFD